MPPRRAGGQPLHPIYPLECKIAIQTNNVEVDDRGYVYLADRADTGLRIVELTGAARSIVNLP
jgi:hypothetical protein